MAAAVADYTPAAARTQEGREDGRPLTLTCTRTPDILADLGRAARGRDARPCSSASPPRPTDVVARAPRQARAQAGRSHRRQRRVARRRRLRRRDQRRHLRRPRRRGRRFRSRAKSALAAHILDRVDALLDGRTVSPSPSANPDFLVPRRSSLGPDCAAHSREMPVRPDALSAHLEFDRDSASTA